MSLSTLYNRFISAYYQLTTDTNPKNDLAHAELIELGFSNTDAIFLLDSGYDIEEIKVRLSQNFTLVEITNAVRIKQLHDRVELSAYRALQERGDALRLEKIDGCTSITSSNSRYLLHTCV